MRKWDNLKVSVPFWKAHDRLLKSGMSQQEAIHILGIKDAAQLIFQPNIKYCLLKKSRGSTLPQILPQLTLFPSSHD